jgi:pilus assembly protein CpaE
MTASAPVAVVEGDESLRMKLSAQLSGLNPVPYPSLPNLVQQVQPGEPMVVVLGPSYGFTPELAQVDHFLRARPELAAILVVDVLSTETLQLALRAGIRDVVSTDGAETQLVEAISRMVGVVPRPRIPGGGGEAAEGPEARVVTVFSTKGGAGKSVIAANLAVTLAQSAKAPVVLVDADLQFGDLAVMLKLTPQHTIVDAVGSIDQLDAQLLNSILIRHSSGVLLLPAPLEPAVADEVSAANLVRVVQVLRTMSAYVVIDTPAQFNEVVLALLEESDDILLVGGMDIPNIKNIKLGLQTLRLLNVPTTKLKLVLNRANSKVRLDVSEVEKTLGVKADVLLPSDIIIPQSVNKGVPAVLDAPKSRFTKGIEQLCELFASHVDVRSGH